jgi:hypothetical protein
MNFNQELEWPDRKSLLKNRDFSSEELSNLDLDKIDFSNEDFKPRIEIKEKQKIYYWIRVYLREEIDIKENTDIKITYLESGEVLECKFICYGKKGAERDSDGVIRFNSEENKKCLCFMIDSDRININSDDIPFIRTLFTISKYYNPQIFSVDMLKITYDGSKEIEYHSIDF